MPPSAGAKHNKDLRAEVNLDHHLGKEQLKKSVLEKRGIASFYGLKKLSELQMSREQIRSTFDRNEKLLQVYNVEL